MQKKLNLHFVVEDFGLSEDRRWHQVIVQGVQNVATDGFQLVLNLPPEHQN